MRLDRPRHLCFVLILFTLITGLSSASAQADRFKNHVLVVYNTANTDSVAIASYYAKKRHIADDHVLGIRAPESEEISRDQFNDLVRDPIDAYLVNKGWLVRSPGRSPFGDQQLPVMAAKVNEIYIIVLIYGMPLKIADDPSVTDTTVSNAALKSNAASVDSELALLPYQGLPITGPLPNPYQMLSTERPLDHDTGRTFDGSSGRQFDGLDAKFMIMVTRLDGPTPDDVRRMIDDAIYAEKTRLVGNVYLDARGLQASDQGYYEGDLWLKDSAKLCRQNGFHTDIDEKPELFTNNLPWTNVAFYAGWYTANATGPFMRDSRTFSRGAIAYHIHSFSAATLHSATANWCGPLIDKGAAVTMGAVYEPYLDLMPQWDIFVDQLLQGLTFAEAAYGSTKALSWMSVFVGDPLYTPFKYSIDDTLKGCVDKPSLRRDFLMIQQARAALYKEDYEQAKTLAEQAIANQGATYVAWEGYAEIMSDPNLEPPNSTVAEAYEKAYNLSITIEDQMRNGLACAQAYENRFRPQDSKRILSMLLSRYTNESVYYGVEAYLRRLNGTDPGVNGNAKPTLAPAIQNPIINSSSLTPHSLPN